MDERPCLAWDACHKSIDRSECLVYGTCEREVSPDTHLQLLRDLVDAVHRRFGLVYVMREQLEEADIRLAIS